MQVTHFGETLANLSLWTFSLQQKRASLDFLIPHRLMHDYASAPRNSSPETSILQGNHLVNHEQEVFSGDLCISSTVGDGLAVTGAGSSAPAALLNLRRSVTCQQ